MIRHVSNRHRHVSDRHRHVIQLLAHVLYNVVTLLVIGHLCHEPVTRVTIIVTNTRVFMFYLMLG